MSEHPSLEVLVDQARDAAALTQEEAQRWFHHMETALEALEQAPSEQLSDGLFGLICWFRAVEVARRAWPDAPSTWFAWQAKLERIYREARLRVTPQQQEQQQRQMRADDARRRMHDEYYHHHESGHSRGIGL